MGLLRNIASFALVVSSLTAPCAQARAQGMLDTGGMPDQEAKSHFEVGKTLYGSGRFSEAAAEFEKAYELSKKVELLYNVYVAHRDASDLPRAIDALRRYLDSAELDAPSRLNLQARLRAMEEASSAAVAPPDAAGAQAAPAGRSGAPGAEPAPDSTETEVEPQVPVPGTAEFEIEPDPELLPYALIGIGGGALIAGVITAVIASAKIADIEEACVNDVCPPPSEFDLEDERDDARTLRTVAFALLGGGVVLSGAGVTLLVLESGEQRAAEPGPQAAVRCGASGCLGTVSGRF